MYVTAPKIPRAFVKNSRIGQVLYLTINEFNVNERKIVYLYFYVKLPIGKIAKLSDLTPRHVTSVLMLYCEKMLSKIDIFKKAVPHDTNDTVSISEMLELEGACFRQEIV